MYDFYRAAVATGLVAGQLGCASLNDQKWYQEARTASSKAVGVATDSSTGHSTGPHVHFEIREGDAAVDPRGVLPKFAFAGDSSPARGKEHLVSAAAH